MGKSLGFHRILLTFVFALLLAGVLVSPPRAAAANIITFGEAAQACGGAVMCSTGNGTAGYLNNGSGVAFNLSTISSWFQIDVNGMSTLPGQPAEPDGGAGGFRVKNDTGSTVNTFSITIADAFTSSTPSVTFCSGSSGPLCDNFQANKGNTYGTGESLSGADFFNCTNPNGAVPCSGTGGQVAANFTSGSVTYTWTGLNIAPGTIFDITFASWNTGASAVNAPEPSTLSLMATGLFGFCALAAWRRKSQRA